MSTRHAFYQQRSGAKRRGIEWLLTFDEWLAWWGDDLSKRGGGHDKLQMQRFGDSGPYALGNIKKGYPADNSKTVRIVRQNKRTAALGKAREAALDRAMFMASAPSSDDPAPDSPLHTSHWGRYHFGSPFKKT